MNDVQARGREVEGGFVAEFRLAHWGGFRPVLTDAGKPRIFDGPVEAELAAHRELIATLYRPIRAEGEKVSATRSKAEALFGAIFKRGRRIEVTRR